MTVPMAVARKVVRAVSWSGEPVDIVRLDYDQRHRRRIAMTGKGGTAFLLDLAETTLLRDGDGLALADGGIVKVEAALEPLAEITAPDTVALARIIWHLGNRHLPTAISEGSVLIRRDHVIEAMVEGLGGTVRPVEAVFDPEGGAYGGHSHGHDHGHSHDDGHHHHHD